MVRFYEKHNLASNVFLFNKETQVDIFFESVFGSVIAGVHIFDTIAASLGDILILQLVGLCGTREIYKIERYRVKEC